MGFLKFIFGLPSANAPVLADQDLVLYAGADENPTSNAFEFAFYCLGNQEYVWLPATTTEEDVILKLQAMEVGQVFRILEEGNDGDPIGSYITAIEVTDDMPIHKIPKGASFLDANLKRVPGF